MFAFQKHARIALVTVFALATTVLAGPPAGVAPPNWRGSGTGSTVLNEIYQDGNGDFHRVDDDTFSGNSTFLGRFTATGQHDLNLTTFTFVGYATWTAANGDSIDVVYSGQLFLGDPVSGPYPFGTHPFKFVDSPLQIVGGTGRFANAEGNCEMSGAFSGDGAPLYPPVPVPDVFYFNFSGTLQSN